MENKADQVENNRNIHKMTLRLPQSWILEQLCQ